MKVPRQLTPRKLTPRQLIHVNLHWDQLSHLNFNLATIDLPTIDPSYFSSSKIELSSFFEKLFFAQNCRKRIISPLLDFCHTKNVTKMLTKIEKLFFKLFDTKKTADKIVDKKSIFIHLRIV